MLLSLLIMAAITAGGLGLTYLIEREEPLMWRLAAGCVIGSAVFGTLAFAAMLWCAVGFVKRVEATYTASTK